MLTEHLLDVVLRKEHEGSCEQVQDDLAFLGGEKPVHHGRDRVTGKRCRSEANWERGSVSSRFTTVHLGDESILQGTLPFDYSRDEVVAGPRGAGVITISRAEVVVYFPVDRACFALDEP